MKAFCALLLVAVLLGVAYAQQGPWSTPRFFKSSLQTGTGSQQSIAHGLGITPRIVFVSTRKLPALAGILTLASTLYTEGAPDSTNVNITALNGLEYYVLAIP